MKLETIGVDSPNGFPSKAYNEIHKFVLSCSYDKSHFHLWREWASAWNGLVYRYGSSDCSNVEYIRSLRLHTASPQPQERYNQEVVIFTFFTSGFSAIECFCYALFAMISMVDPTNFSLTTPKDKKGVTYTKLTEKLEKHFSEEEITKRLRQLIDSEEF